MLQAGDKVIFIGDDSCILSDEYNYLNDCKLVYGKEYEIYSNDSRGCSVTEIFTPYYTSSSFVTLKEFRSLKLKKIENHVTRR